MTPPDWSLRPALTDHSAFHARYIERVPDGDVLATLERDGDALVRLLRAVPADRERFAYAPGKWTVREVVGHMVDTERVLTLRALWFARSGAAPLPGFEEEEWGRVSNAGERRLAEIVDELAAVRRSTLFLFRSFDAAALEHRGVANGAEFTARAMAWIVAGHALHHRRILEDQYRI
jgi:hypothetical protein